MRVRCVRRRREGWQVAAAAVAVAAWVLPAWGADGGGEAAEPADRDPVEAALGKQAEDLAKRLIDHYAGVEAEQAALVQEVGEADERALAAEARAAAAERELRRVLGEPVAEAAPDGPASDAAVDAVGPRPAVAVERDALERVDGMGLGELKLPERRVNALGVVDRTGAGLAPAPAGAVSLAVVPLPREGAETGSLEVEGDGSGVAFVAEGSLTGGEVVLARLGLSGGEVRWSWEGAAAGAAREALGELDRLLASAVVEARDAGGVVARWQFEPAVVRVGLRASGRERETAALGSAWTGVTLAPELEAGARGWVVDGRGVEGLGLVTETHAALVSWDAGRGEVVVEVREEPGGATAHLDRQIASWEADVEAMRRGGGSAATLARAEAYVAALRERKLALAEASSAGGAASRAVVRLVASNGVTAARVVIGE